QSGDLHGLTFTTRPAALPFGKFRSASIFFGAVAQREVSFGPELGTVNVTTAATSPSLRPRVQYTRQAEYNQYWFVNYQQQAGGVNRDHQVYVTAAYQGG